MMKISIRSTSSNSLVPRFRAPGHVNLKRTLSSHAGKNETVVVPTTFNVPAVSFGLSAVSFACDAKVFAILTALFGVITLLPATKFELVFGSDAMGLIAKESGETTPNRLVGGENSWRYDSITSWRIFPSPGFPVILTWMETATKPEGQFHAMPAIFDPRTFVNTLEERCKKR